MVDAAPQSWFNGRRLRGFALPQGPLAGLMGWIMARGNGVEQADVLSVLGSVTGQDVVEVGYGPGTLVRALLDGGASVVGVDPSARMRTMACRRNRDAVRDGRAELRVGTAEDTGVAGECADLVVSVNNVPMWSSLSVGTRELRRLLRPGGRLVVSWHGGTEPTGMARRLSLPDEALDRILDVLRETFDHAERHDLTHVVAFSATAEP